MIEASSFQKSKLGNTKINFIKEEDKELNESSKNKPDIIIVIPEKPININGNII